MQPFVTANWRYLAMLNFVVDPAIVAPLVPPGTELDFENGETYISLVGFLFLDTRVIGLPIPLHRDFEEVNLRFYVRRKSADTWRRGVVFIREMVPRRAIAVIARAFYGEPYRALPMKHEIEHLTDDVPEPSSPSTSLRPRATAWQAGISKNRLKVEYGWRSGRKWESLQMSATGEPQSIPVGSHADFITEHYWGYTCVKAGCSEYRVEHPLWKIWNAESFELNADIESLYGKPFAETMAGPPRSAFIADGSPIAIYRSQVQ